MSTSPSSGSACGYLWWRTTAPRTDDQTKLILARQLLVLLNELIPRNDCGHWEILDKPWKVPTERQLAQLTEKELREDIVATAAEVNRVHTQLMTSVGQPM